jgi:hypothetical protein
MTEVQNDNRKNVYPIQIAILENKIPMNVIELCRYFKKIQPEKRALKINLSKL